MAIATPVRGPGAAHRASRVGLYAALIVAGTIAALPFVWLILSSFKGAEEIRQVPPTFLPEDPTLDNYTTIINDPELPLLTFYRNSVFVSVFTVAGTLFTSSLLGYILAKFEFRGRGALFWFVIATMIIPVQVTMIPGYLILLKLNLLNNLWGLILPSLFDAFGIFVMRQFIRSLRCNLLTA